MGFILPGTLSGRSGGFIQPGSSVDPPEVISNLIYWFRADTECFTDLAATIPAADGEFVRACGDRSGNVTTPFTVETDGRRPILRASGLGGQASLEFDGIDDRLRLLGASAGQFEIERTDAVSFLVVFVKDDSTRSALWDKDVSGAQTGWRLEYISGDIRFALQNTAGVNGLLVDTTNSLSVATNHVVIVTYDGSSTAAGVNIYVDSATPEAVTIGLDTLTLTSVSTNNLRFSGRGIDEWDGDMAEKIFYGKELSGAEISDLMTYAGDRYGITIS